MGEAARNVASGTARAGVFAAVYGTLLTTLLAVDAAAVVSLADEARRYRSSGAATVTVSLTGGIDGVACEALAKVPGVVAAGALRTAARPVIPAALPRSPLDVYEVSLGFLDVLDAGRGSSVDIGKSARGGERTRIAGIVVGGEAAELLGASPGTDLATDRGELAVAASYPYPADGRRPGFGWAALVVFDAATTYDECWLTVWPSSAAVRAVAMTSIAAAAPSAAPADARVQIGQLNTQHGVAFLGFARFSGRSTAIAPLVGVGIAVIAAVVAVRVRRLEFAARLHDGSSRMSVVILALVESLVWLAPSSLIAVASAAAMSVASPPADAAAIVSAAAAASAAALLGGMSGGFAAVCLVRERHLFAYFSDR